MENYLFNRYAIAFLDLSIQEKSVNNDREELKILKNVLKENKEYQRILYGKNISLNEKYDLIDRSFKDLSSHTRSFLKVIVKNNISFYMYEIIKESLYRFDDYLNIESGTLYFAKKPSDEDIKKIIETIEKDLNKRIDLNIVIKPDLIGGFKVVLKNNIYDASIKTKLDSLKNYLVKE